MIEVNERCCGCTACISICPVKCIRPAYRDGFMFPEAAGESCIGCGLCESRCPVLHTSEKSRNLREGFYAYSLDPRSRGAGSSGGVFHELARAFLRAGGVVYGAAFDEDFRVRHRAVTREEELPAIQGSKYAESDLADTFPEIDGRLRRGERVMFSGTPCQCAGLKSYLGGERSGLILVDLFCYGIQSPRVWEIYLQAVHGDRDGIAGINMRDKTYGWQNYAMRVDYADGSVYCRDKKHDPYLKGYSKGLFIRPSCYDCTLKQFPRESDVTLGDFWEVNDMYRTVDAKNGVSMVLTNTAAGRTLLDSVRDRLFCESIDVERLTRIHPDIGRSADRNKNRDAFMTAVDADNFTRLIEKYAVLPLYKRIPLACKKTLLRLGVWELAEPVWNALRAVKNKAAGGQRREI